MPGGALGVYVALMAGSAVPEQQSISLVILIGLGVRGASSSLQSPDFPASVFLQTNQKFQ
jgi:hypothetical protein